MGIEIKSGSLADFLVSTKATAKEIDEAKTITKKNIIWMEPADLFSLLKPERTKLIKVLRRKKKLRLMNGHKKKLNKKNIDMLSHQYIAKMDSYMIHKNIDVFQLINVMMHTLILMLTQETVHVMMDIE